MKLKSWRIGVCALMFIAGSALGGSLAYSYAERNAERNAAHVRLELSLLSAYFNLQTAQKLREGKTEEAIGILNGSNIMNLTVIRGLEPLTSNDVTYPEFTEFKKRVLNSLKKKWDAYPKVWESTFKSSSINSEDAEDDKNFRDLLRGYLESKTDAEG